MLYDNGDKWLYILRTLSLTLEKLVKKIQTGSRQLLTILGKIQFSL